MMDTSLRHHDRRGARFGAGCGKAFARLLVTLALALAALLPQAVGAQAMGSSTMAAAPGQAAAVARTGAQRIDAVEAELVADVARAVPGQPFRLGLRLAHDPHWHTYWRNPGDSGLPTRFEPSGPAGTTFGDITWPAPRRLAIGDLANYGYEGELVLAREVILPSSLSEFSVRFEVQAQWLVCKEVCIPGEAVLALDLPIGPSPQPAAPRLAKLFDTSASSAPRAGARRDAGWWQRDTQAWLLLPEGAAASRAEFFPYFEGVVRPAAPQSLIATVAADQRAADRVSSTDGRLALRLETVAPVEGGLPQSAAGVLLLDGQVIEVGLKPIAEEPVAGPVLAVAEVAPSAPAPGRSLFDRLIGGKGPSAAAGPATGTAIVGAGAGSASAAAGAAYAGAGAAAPAAARPFPAAAIGGTAGTLMIALAGALLGGLILNLMPCVFPVIGLKVLSFSQSASGNPGAARRHALAFGAGVVLSFLSLGLLMLALRHAGEAAGWGFQMQSPVFVGAMALLFVLIGLNLFGVFETGVALTRLAQVPPVRSSGALAGATHGVDGAAGSRNGGNGFGSSFGTGVIAVLVATPCTAPFMGSAVGYTLSSPPLQTLLVFATLGVGMALPYLVLGWAPRLLRWLPRPGPWLLVFKQLLAFPMLATGAWLAWVLTLQSGADGLLRLLLAAILLSFAAWVYGRAQQAALGGRARPRALGLAAAAVAGVLSVWQLAQIGLGASSSDAQAGALRPASVSGAYRSDGGTSPLAGAGPIAGTGPVADAVAGASAVASAPSSTVAGGFAHADAGGVQWQPWSSQKVAQSLAQGRPVLVDFTAAWCISCQANKKLVLERDVVKRTFQEQGVTLLRADWTRRDPAITAELANFGRNGVPLYLVYHSAGELPLMLPELLTVDVVLAALANGR